MKGQETLFHVPDRDHISSLVPRPSIEMAGNIIPAIATTNAIIAGLIVLQALHLPGPLTGCEEAASPSAGLRRGHVSWLHNTGGQDVLGIKQLLLLFVRENFVSRR